MAEDYYSVLGVPKNASQADIQKAYRELARKYHPDMNPDDKTAKKKFQKVQAAFDVLNNPEKREMYDRYGSSFETMGRRRTAGGAIVELVARRRRRRPGRANSAEDIDLSQFLGERFGQEGPAGSATFSASSAAPPASSASRPPAQQRSGDLVQEIQIPFTTSITGGEVQLTDRTPFGQNGDARGEDSAGHRGRQEDPHPRPRPTGPARRHARRHPVDRSRSAAPVLPPPRQSPARRACP